jgi:hypothetical protein
MTNVFKKLIRKEFGDRNYYKYFFCYQNMLYDENFEIDKVTKDEVYTDIYNNLKKLDKQNLIKRHSRLSDTMVTAFSITNTFLIVIGFYAVAMWLLISQGFNPMVAKVSMVIISVAFLYKLYEYILNKFCYVDVHIAIIYKTVLESLIENQ